MKNILVFSLLLFAQCTTTKEEKTVVKKYFDITEFSERLILTHSGEMTAVVVNTDVNGVKDKIQYLETDSTFWATELFMILQADINKPSLLDAYKIEEKVTEENSNLLKIIYTALPTTNNKVKKIEIKYLEELNEVRQISGEIESDNSVYKTHQAFHIWLNRKGEKLLIDSLTTAGFNKTIFMDSMVYFSALKVL